MNMLGKVQIKTHYTRSVNLERDADSIEVIRAYIPTTRVLKLFDQISNGFTNKQAPRAWSIVGPYGAGKSASQNFLSQLLSSPDVVATKAAYKVLKSASPDLSKVFTKETKGTKGYLKVLITGSPQAMGKCILQGLLQASEQHWTTIKGKNPKIIKLLSDVCGSESVTSTALIDLVNQLQTALLKTGCKGIVLVIDELGKFLEYEARHYGTNDIYLLQALAEQACAKSDRKLFLFVLLHQSFEQYAKGLGESLKNEWSKVQGRFEEVPFLESAEQVLRVVGAAFEHRFTTNESVKLRKQTEKIVKTLIQKEALPSTLDTKSATDLLCNTYPLHPVSAILLPMLCQKVAQNERTLFSYLGSHEEYGLQDMLSRLDSIDSWVYPHHIYDYFITNQPAALGDHTTHRRWAEVVISLGRLGDAPEEQVCLLKTIGILNIIGIKGNLKASKAILETCAQSGTNTSSVIKSLVNKSIITYRKFSGEYRVWQGSDFDLENAVEEELNNLGEFPLATVLNDQQALLSVVARRYTIESGALRYFVPEFVDAQTFKKSPKQIDIPRIIFFLASAQDDEKIFYEEVTKNYSNVDLVGLCLNGVQLREATAEVLALRMVQITKQELNSDPVAKREFEDRLTAAEQSESAILQSLLDNPEETVWFNRGKQLAVTRKRNFQENLSSILKKAYSKAPVLHNELINRDRPSVQATSARNKLLSAMLNHQDKVDLGIEKFPPEKAIYRSILRETGVHNTDTMRFVVPPKNSTLFSVWQRIDEFLDSTEDEAKSLTCLNQSLMAPPYGVKAGVLPIIYIAVYIVYQHELALYEERCYRPFFTEEMIERFVKRPDEFTFQRFRISGLRASIYQEYSKVVASGNQLTIVQLARPLAKWIGGLELYTQKTKSVEISDRAKRIRDAFNLAKSPENLLLEGIPEALGYEQELKKKQPNLEGFASALNESLQELKSAYPNMIKQQIKMLLQAFHMDKNGSLADLRRKSSRYEGLEKYTVDVDGLKAFIKRLTKPDGDNDNWLENILMFLGQKPSAKWTDTDRGEADVKLSYFAERIIDLETLRLHYDKRSMKTGGDFDVIFLKSLKKGGKLVDEAVVIEHSHHIAIQGVKEKLKKVLCEHKNSELQLAVLAELVNEFLTDRVAPLSSRRKEATPTKIRQVKHG